MEEVLLNAQREVVASHTDYQIQFDFDQIPEEDHLTLVMGNEALLKNVFVNLLENACKYTPNHQASLRLGFDAEWCQVRVIDQGIGISKQDLPNIFQPFYRAKNAIDYHGFGIGLSVVKRIVELHEGQLEVKSRPHLGTEFMVRLKHLKEESARDFIR